MTTKDKLLDERDIVNRFKGKLIKLIKDVNGKFDDYSISPVIRYVLLHELVEDDLLSFIFLYI